MFRRPTNPPRSRAGFTLMELLLVLVILVVLGSMTVAFFGGTRERAFVNAAKSDVSAMASAVDRYEFDMRAYPAKLEDLVNEPTGEGAEDWAGPYVRELNEDPWRHPYRYAQPGKKNSDRFDVWSVGPDGQDGTDDDIGNWSK
jgi:general secretion pathway protein G